MNRRLPLALLLVLVTTGTLADSGAPTTPPHTAVATFAGGCFWCMEEAFDRVVGVLSTTAGYTGGHVERPGYAQVTAGGTGHVEAVRVTWDTDKVSYEQLLSVFWRNVDALDGGGQFCDRGDSYLSVIFAHTQQQRRLAEQSLQRLSLSAGFDKPIRTSIAAVAPFYEAEAIHQGYWLSNPMRYSFYKYQCGREQRLQRLWEDSAVKP